MNCERVRKILAAAADRGVADGIVLHLEHCRQCAHYAREVSDLNVALHCLPSKTPPARLITQLQILASRERMRQLSRGTLTGLVRFWAGELYLLFDNLMRPFAIPFAGGLVSALFLFTMLAPGLHAPRSNSNDVLLSGLFGQTQATFDTLPPFGFLEDDVVVEVTLDRDGSVLDYAIPNNVNGKLRNDIANMILFTTFQPATEFGMPVASKVLVSFRRDRINVKG
jgi:hypothetical protein